MTSATSSSSTRTGFNRTSIVFYWRKKSWLAKQYCQNECFIWGKITFSFPFLPLKLQNKILIFYSWFTKHNPELKQGFFKLIWSSSSRRQPWWILSFFLTKTTHPEKIYLYNNNNKKHTNHKLLSLNCFIVFWIIWLCLSKTHFTQRKKKEPFILSDKCVPLLSNTMTYGLYTGFPSSLTHNLMWSNESWVVFFFSSTQ